MKNGFPSEVKSGHSSRGLLMLLAKEKKKQCKKYSEKKNCEVKFLTESFQRNKTSISK